ncbi:MAG TPA: histidinol dehydrogenase, partial [Candidatus Limnocylindria bacterium]|nr:histidinol dehydrogenase [Candidatus Limnocylindria bacterium]
ADQRALLSADRHVQTGPGVVAWRRWLPIERAGGYVPGGRASYPSSVLMLGVPAQLAGVGELLLATPPRPDGSVDPSVLVAAAMVGVRRVLRVGGAQAVAALAYGTASVPRVDRIFGAGNAWVTAAKRLVAADTALDLPAGPSEAVVIADGDADPAFVAADLLAQAEHGPDSVAILLTDAAALLPGVEAEIERQAAKLATGERAVTTLRAWGRCLLVSDMATAVEVANGIAAEHVSLQCADAESLVERLRNAGAAFIGPWSPIAAGDYATGTNHVLPTGAAARAYSGVGVESFGRWMEVQRVAPSAAERLARTVGAIAGAEGLPAHAASVSVRAERAASAEARGDDPVELLRRPAAVEAYAAEASDEELAAAAGLNVAQIVRNDMNTIGEVLPNVASALRDYDTTRLSEYGDLAYARLRAALSEKLGVEPSRIIPGAGADELIRLVTTAVVAEGDVVVVPTPTFAMFAVEAQLAGARAVNVPRGDLAQRQDVEAIRAAVAETGARLVWLCTPNNPTGDRYALDEVRRLAADLPAIVAVDEVYLEYAEFDAGVAANSTSAIELQAELPNIIVLRSLSKAYGLAGARLGYLVAPAPLADRFDAIRLPLSVAGPSEAVAIAALNDATAGVRRAAIVAERRRLAAALEELGAEVLPSVANFVTFRPRRGGPDADAVARQLFAGGIVLRTYEGGPMTGWLRATALASDKNERLIEALREAMA